MIPASYMQNTAPHFKIIGNTGTGHLIQLHSSTSTQSVEDLLSWVPDALVERVIVEVDRIAAQSLQLSLFDDPPSSTSGTSV